MNNRLSCSAPTTAPPTPAARPRVPKVLPIPIQLSSSYTGNEFLHVQSPTRSLLNSPFNTSPACSWNNDRSSGFIDEEVRRIRESSTILSMLQRPSLEQELHYQGEVEIEDELQFSLSLSS